MSQYQYNSDNLERRGFISKESILNLVSEEDIFELVFKFKPQELDYVVSPLRKDRSPGCWFIRHSNNILYFVDFGHTRIHSDCFNIVQDYFQIPNFYLTLKYIYDTLINGKSELVSRIRSTEIVKEKKKVKIVVEPRQFNYQDGLFYSPYGITKQNLMEDRVFPFNRAYLLNTKTGSHVINCRDIAYSYNEFPEARKKLYFPLKKGKERFISTCTKDDVGGLKFLPTYGKTLIITKGYKDYRVLRNSGKNVIWTQNEGMIPNDLILNPLVRHFVNIIVWYDNDQPGIIASEKLKNHINSIVPGKAKNLWLPEKAYELGIKDPSDCRKIDETFYNQFLKEFTL